MKNNSSYTARDSVDVEAAINWKYTQTQLDAFERLMQQYRKTSLAMHGRANTKNELIYLVSELITFKLSVSSLFKGWLEKENKDKKQTLTPLDYEGLKDGSLLNNPHKLLNMCDLVCEWAQTEGPFSTLNKKRNPLDAWN